MTKCCMDSQRFELFVIAAIGHRNLTLRLILFYVAVITIIHSVIMAFSRMHRNWFRYQWLFARYVEKSCWQVSRQFWIWISSEPTTKVFVTLKVSRPVSSDRFRVIECQRFFVEPKAGFAIGVILATISVIWQFLTTKKEDDFPCSMGRYGRPRVRF